jgi:hypothetical protein
MIILASIVVGIGMAALLFRVFFDDLEDLGECVKYWLTPDIISMFRGEWAEDQWASLKLMAYLFFCVGSGWLTDIGLHKLFG